MFSDPYDDDQWYYDGDDDEDYEDYEDYGDYEDPMFEGYVDYPRRRSIVAGLRNLIERIAARVRRVLRLPDPLDQIPF